eukprot:TRINITY_DN3270_c0_g1_i1.p2 TRINITY_DN3270_c0_g1~~TRINITY_DN3270_c0_g1_i1.p2  ORF type:complete len:126 (+),score=23.65 TRINITY_DN3270_c0_g1_i1:108-485(+)
MVDALPTLMLMGLDPEVAAARSWIAANLTWAAAGEVSVFETTIRVLGGLLSAYHLSGDPLYADRAVELGRRLAPAVGGFGEAGAGTTTLPENCPTGGCTSASGRWGRGKRRGRGRRSSPWPTRGR